jgi:endoglucanase
MAAPRVDGDPAHPSTLQGALLMRLSSISALTSAVTVALLSAVAAPSGAASSSAAQLAPIRSATGGSALPGPADHTLPAGTRFYVDPAGDAAKQAIADLKQHHVRDALAMATLASWPEAQWFTDGTPAEVTASVRRLVRSAARQRSVPVLVAYNVPLRDCGLYSSGGAQSDAAYRAWIDGMVSGLGSGRSVVIVEPDGLANLPSDCGPSSDPTGELTAGRIADLNYAVTRLATNPGVSVYLDAGNTAWRSVGDIAGRLIEAGVARSQGFSLNVSNSWPTSANDHYGRWVAQCIWFATAGPASAAGHTDWCASQYYSPAAPNDGAPGNAVRWDDESTWHWSDDWFEQNLGAIPGPDVLTHFIVDTSRNGIGGWTPPAGLYSDAQVWCNAPGRGVGVRPTADTGKALVDAYLYVKTIGQSDGQCTRGTAGPGDPEYGNTVDPIAGAWWPAQARSLVAHANPTLTFNVP